MKKLANWICQNKNKILIVTLILFVLSLVGMKLTKVNYDILVYLPEEIETVEGQNILTEEFGMGAYTVVLAKNLSSKEILAIEEQFKNIDGVSKVLSIYDAIGTNIPLEYLPNDITEKLYKENTDLLFVTFEESTSSLSTIEAIREMKEISNDKMQISGMSSMVLDTMDLSESEIFVYIVIAVLLCLFVLEISLDSYLVPILLLANIGISILFNLGSNILLGEISYITKALVAVLQLGVTTDFSIFLYHAYEKNKKEKNKEMAMRDAILETFTSVTGSSLTTIAGFLVLCTMNLTLGRDLGLVMAKGVFLGVVCVLTVFPSLLLFFDKVVEKTKHKPITVHFHSLNTFVVKHHKVIFVLFVLLLIPAYLANSKVDVYYKIDKSLPNTLDSIVANTELKEKFNIVSPEIVLYNKDLKTDDVQNMVERLENIAGIDFVLTFAKLESLGLSKEMLPSDLVNVFLSGHYQMMLINSVYEIASDELNAQIDEVNQVIRTYDDSAILAGEGPLMKDLVTISDEDFRNVNVSSIVCILVIMVFVLKSFSLPILLIIAIEFAIFLNMSVSYFGGIVLPFVAPIVLGTIQLGATIDYAILMTTNYMKLRREDIKKEDALIKTTDYCSNSIFVSGMCFFAATFGVGVYSELEMVGSLCSLISRGAIISMFVVLMVLPSILCIFDTWIMKTTYKGKETKNMKKNKRTKFATAMFVGMVLFMPSQVFALSKEETVYAKLNTDGTVKSVLVSEHLVNNEEEASIQDYSDLENILNTHSNHTYTRNENLLTWESNGNSIFYQGTTNKALPIESSITYKLDGKEISLDELIGKQGHVVMNIQYKNKSKFVKKIAGKNTEMYTPFMVVTGTMIASENNKNVTVTNGRVMDNGSKYIVVGLSAPGLYESLDLKEFKDMDTIKIELDTEKFELPSIYAMASSKLIEESDLKIFDQMNALTKNVSTLQTSIDKIEDGSKELLNGVSALSSGSKELASGIETVYKSLEEIKKGTVTVNEGVSKMITSLEAVKIQMSSNTQLQTIGAMIQNGYIVPGDGTTKDDMIIALYKQVTDTTMVDTLIASLKQLQTGTKTLVDGTTTLTKGVGVLNKETKKLVSGVSELKTGAKTLNSGIHAFNQSGIQKLSSLASQANTLSNKVSTLVQLGEDYQTFTMKDKKMEGTTKFVLVVDGIKAPTEKKENNQEETKETFFTRFKNLFK